MPILLSWSGRAVASDLVVQIFDRTPDDPQTIGPEIDRIDDPLQPPPALEVQD